ncbi:MAG TPA: hypothetical protein VEH04_16890 [Verrucomicrobiae bacterium]|nr:hypothetical protein [Verrucomicrobiae bacterium]
MSNSPRKVIAVDLDGTLAEYHGWRGRTRIGSPIEPMVERVKQWLAQGYEVEIFTARMAPVDLGHDDGGVSPTDVLAAIEAWCEKHIGRKLPVTATKRRFYSEFWDDRAVQIIPNTGIPVAEQALNALSEAEEVYKGFLELGPPPPAAAELLERLRVALGLPEDMKPKEASPIILARGNPLKGLKI